MNEQHFDPTRKDIDPTPEDGAAFEWELSGWGYGWASAASPEEGLREVAVEAVRTGKVSLRWRLDDDEGVLWQTAAEDGPVAE